MTVQPDLQADWPPPNGARRESGGSPLPIFRFLLDSQDQGLRVALATLVDVSGSSARAVGAHMAIREDGGYAGSFSGGCVEAAIAAEAQQAIRERRARKLRFGAGSPFIDIRLPCGGGIDLIVLPDPPRTELERARTLLENRQAATLSIDPDRSSLAVAEAGPEDRTGWDQGRFLARHSPPLKLSIIGGGPESEALIEIAAAWGAELAVASPDPDILRLADAAGAPELCRLLTASSPLTLAGDPWTAFILLFHDHGWESELLPALLQLQSFYLGAMGSAKTHAARLADLGAKGIAPERAARIRGPIGLIPSARDPATLALSAFAEIVGEYERLAR